MEKIIGMAMHHLDGASLSKNKWDEIKLNIDTLLQV